MPRRSAHTSCSTVPAEVLADPFIGVFETLRAYQGVLFSLEDHLTRFEQSLATCGVGTKISSRELARGAYRALAASGLRDAMVRLTRAGERQIVFVVPRKPYRRSLYAGGAALRTCATRKHAAAAFPPQVKTSSYLNQILATLDVQAAGEPVFETLFLSPEGWVEEARISNLFVVHGGALKTPPASGVLDGVTRRFVIKCARRLGIPVAEIPLTRHDVYTAKEAFLTSTSAEVLPVSRVDGRAVGGRKRPVTCRVARAFSEGVKSYVAWAKKHHPKYLQLSTHDSR